MTVEPRRLIRTRPLRSSHVEHLGCRKVLLPAGHFASLPSIAAQQIVDDLKIPPSDPVGNFGLFLYGTDPNLIFPLVVFSPPICQKYALDSHQIGSWIPQGFGGENLKKRTKRPRYKYYEYSPYNWIVYSNPLYPHTKQKPFPPPHPPVHSSALNLAVAWDLLGPVVEVVLHATTC